MAPTQPGGVKYEICPLTPIRPGRGRRAGRAAPWRPPARVLALLSGGADSVCLVHALAQHLGPERVEALHVTTACAPAADEDERFCARAVRARWACGCTSSGCDVDRTGNLEAPGARGPLRGGRGRARAVRDSTWWPPGTRPPTRWRRSSTGWRRRPAAARCSAWRRCRGRIVRPLLERERRATRAPTAARPASPWREDESNQDRALARNRLRLDVLPALREIHPAAEANVLATAAQLRDEQEVLERAVDEALERARRGRLPARRRGGAPAVRAAGAAAAGPAAPRRARGRRSAAPRGPTASREIERLAARGGSGVAELGARRARGRRVRGGPVRARRRRRRRPRPPSCRCPARAASGSGRSGARAGAAAAGAASWARWTSRCSTPAASRRRSRCGPGARAIACSRSGSAGRSRCRTCSATARSRARCGARCRWWCRGTRSPGWRGWPSRTSSSSDERTVSHDAPSQCVALFARHRCYDLPARSSRGSVRTTSHSVGQVGRRGGRLQRRVARARSARSRATTRAATSS